MEVEVRDVTSAISRLITADRQNGLSLDNTPALTVTELTDETILKPRQHYNEKAKNMSGLIAVLSNALYSELNNLYIKCLAPNERGASLPLQSLPLTFRATLKREDTLLVSIIHLFMSQISHEAQWQADHNMVNVMEKSLPP